MNLKIERRTINLTGLLNQITRLPWRFAEMDNDKVIPTVRLFGRRKTDPTKIKVADISK